MDPYRTLQLQPGAPRDLIVEAYWLLVARSKQRWRPEGAPSVGQLNAAYELLANDDRRRSFDEAHAYTAPHAPRVTVKRRLVGRPSFRADHRDHYDLLRIDRNAGDEIINLAHRIMTAQASGPRAEAEYLRSLLHEARRTLTNAHLRAQYDTTLQPLPPAAPQAEPQQPTQGEPAPEPATTPVDDHHHNQEHLDAEVPASRIPLPASTTNTPPLHSLERGPGGEAAPTARPDAPAEVPASRIPHPASNEASNLQPPTSTQTPPLHSLERGPGGEATPTGQPEATASTDIPPLHSLERGPGGEATPTAQPEAPAEVPASRIPLPASNEASTLQPPTGQPQSPSGVRALARTLARLARSEARITLNPSVAASEEAANEATARLATLAIETPSEDPASRIPPPASKPAPTSNLQPPAAQHEGGPGGEAPAAYLHVTAGPRTGEQLPLGDETLSIGSSPDADITLEATNGDRIAPEHARIWHHGGRFAFRELIEQGGATVNGTPLLMPIVLLDPNDEIRLGGHVLKFVIGSR